MGLSGCFSLRDGSKFHCKVKLDLIIVDCTKNLEQIAPEEKLFFLPESRI